MMMSFLYHIFMWIDKISLNNICFRVLFIIIISIIIIIIIIITIHDVDNINENCIPFMYDVMFYCIIYLFICLFIYYQGMYMFRWF